MNFTNLIAQHLLDVQNGDNWTEINIELALADVSFEEANQHADGSANTIAMLLHHISFWNRSVAQRAVGIVPHVGEDNGFDTPLLSSKEEWEELQKDNIRSAEQLATAIINFEESKLTLPILPDHATAYKNFQGSVEHAHYHLGQMVLLKKIIKATE